MKIEDVLPSYDNTEHVLLSFLQFGHLHFDYVNCVKIYLLIYKFS